MQHTQQTVCLRKSFSLSKNIHLLIIFYILICCDRRDAGIFLKCNKNYLNFDKNHTACKSPTNDCIILKSGISKSDIEKIIVMHNNYRNGIASGNETSFGFPSSSNMYLMEWDNELAVIAQAHALQCHFQHDCYSCRRTDKYEIVGQNLFLYRTSNASFIPNWSVVIQMWYDELKIAPKNIVNKFYSSGLNIGHFTQMVWADTSKIGCGYVAHALFNSVYKVAHLYTCNYAPGGNYIGVQMYQIGAPASSCPHNSTPSIYYKSLCKRIKTSSKQYNFLNKKDKRFKHTDSKISFSSVQRSKTRKIIINNKRIRKKYFQRYYFNGHKFVKIDNKYT